MSDNDLTYQDYLDRINIQDVLVHAGYTLNRRDGLRYPSYVRHDSNGRRIHGDKFIVTNHGTSCFRPPEQKTYNLISLIKTFPSMFPEHVRCTNPDHLVNEVCRTLLNAPNEHRGVIVGLQKEAEPFNLNEYSIHAFRKYDFDSIKKFYPFFVTRGINLDTQKAFSAHFILATKEAQAQGKTYTNLSFPMYVPGNDNVVGLEERGRPRLDGSSGYKGKAMGSNSSEGLWIAQLGKGGLAEAKHVYWFESAYDAMSYYQLHMKDKPELNKAIFVSTGGNPTVGQMRGMLKQTPTALHHICFDNDLAGRQFAENFRNELHQQVRFNIIETPERKPYLDSLPFAQDLANGNIDLLPDSVKEKYAKYESAWEETMSMRQSRLCFDGDIKEQEKQTKALYKDFRSSLQAFLGISSMQDTQSMREIPFKGKDWNEQLLLAREEGRLAADETDETRNVTSGIDLDADGEIETCESDEKKQSHKVRR